MLYLIIGVIVIVIVFVILFIRMALTPITKSVYCRNCYNSFKVKDPRFTGGHEPGRLRM